MRTANPSSITCFGPGLGLWIHARCRHRAPGDECPRNGRKTLYLLVITAASAAAGWGMYKQPEPDSPHHDRLACGQSGGGHRHVEEAKIAGFVVPVFAFGEGLFVAAFSAAVVYFSPTASRSGSDAAAYAMMGQAAGLTIAIAAAMLFGYASGVLRSQTSWSR